MPSQPTEQQIREVLAAWSYDQADIVPIEEGLINLTYRIQHNNQRYLLQRLNPIFGPQVHNDIEAITSRLGQQGLSTPRLIPTTQTNLWHQDSQGGIWRVFTFMAGKTIQKVTSAAQCDQAGRLLGRFHQALWMFDYDFQHTRLGVHDLPSHLQNLRQALSDCSQHANFGQVWPLAQQILNAAARLPSMTGFPLRKVHGDPKISNIIFSDKNQALCFVDLDTLAHMPIPYELGDALRSWCCPAGEESIHSNKELFSIEYCRRALDSYLAVQGNNLLPIERQAIPSCVLRISIELSARFCADALYERYFQWDAKRYHSASEHNLIRAQVQFQTSQRISQNLPLIERLL